MEQWLPQSRVACVRLTHGHKKACSMQDRPENSHQRSQHASYLESLNLTTFSIVGIGADYSSQTNSLGACATPIMAEIAEAL